LTLFRGILPVVRLSIVIPVLGKLKKLEDTLVSVLENRPAQCEIVVVLNEPYDDPYELAGEVSFIEAPLRAGLVDCLNRGIAASRGIIVHTLGCGTEVTPLWTDAVLPHFERSEIASVTASVFDRANPERLLSRGVGYHPGGAAWRLGFRQAPMVSPSPLPAYFGPDPVAGFYRRCVLEAAGGFCPDLQNHLAGVELALVLQFAGHRCVEEPNCRIVADRTRRMGLFRACLGHAGLLTEECLESIVQPTTLGRLFGRMWETMRTPLRKRIASRPKEMRPAQDSVIACPHFLNSLDRNCPPKVSKAS
jgi:hypothetical protein